MAIYEIPLNPYAERFQIEIAGEPYYLQTHWNVPMQRWTLDIGRSETEWLVTNLAMVNGLNLLEPYEHLGFNFELRLWIDGDLEGEASYDGLGTAAKLLVVTE